MQYSSQTADHGIDFKSSAIINLFVKSNSHSAACKALNGSSNAMSRALRMLRMPIAHAETRSIDPSK
jgi:hypothetical protein